jgi:HTH-type transcriptional regulator, competence development regulator
MRGSGRSAQATVACIAMLLNKLDRLNEHASTTAGGIEHLPALGHGQQVANEMTLGQKLREFRKAKRLSLRELASRVDVGFTYLSQIENHKLEDGHRPSEKLLQLLAFELGGNEEELLLLAGKVPEPIRRRVIDRPDVFRRFAELSDRKLDRIIAGLD